jgi:hypothetical protein
MSARWWCTLALAAGFVSAAHAQFTLTAVVGSTEQPVPGVYDLSAVSCGDAVVSRFRLRNASNAPATLTLLVVAGAGFALASAPSLPATLGAQQTVDFMVGFRASETGSYSAALRSDGISALLSIAVVPSLTYAVETVAGKQLLGVGPIDFGAVELGQTKALHFDINNLTAQAMNVPAIEVGAGDFALSNAAPGVLLQPGQAIGFDIQPPPTIRVGVLPQCEEVLVGFPGQRPDGGRWWQMLGPGVKFGRKKEEALAGLLTHRNTEEAARAIGVAPYAIQPSESPCFLYPSGGQIYV